MTVDTGYKCKKCNKVYHKSKSDLPIYCKGCGEELVKERYCYNLTEYRGKAVETRDTNMFGGYDYIKTTGIYFENASNTLGNDGWIKLYNAETGSLIETFTASTWGSYTKDKPYAVDLK